MAVVRTSEKPSPDERVTVPVWPVDFLDITSCLSGSPDMDFAISANSLPLAVNLQPSTPRSTSVTDIASSN